MVVGPSAMATPTMISAAAFRLQPSLLTTRQSFPDYLARAGSEIGTCCAEDAIRTSHGRIETGIICISQSKIDISLKYDKLEH